MQQLSQYSQISQDPEQYQIQSTVIRPRGQGQKRVLTMDHLSSVYNLPIADAANQLDVGVTVLKKFCRKYGIKRWPYRKLRSMDKLIDSVEQKWCEKHPGEKDKLVEAVQDLKRQKVIMQFTPSIDMESRTKKLRQANFKQQYKWRHDTAYRSNPSSPDQYQYSLDLQQINLDNKGKAQPIISEQKQGSNENQKYNNQISNIEYCQSIENQSKQINISNLLLQMYFQGQHNMMPQQNALQKQQFNQFIQNIFTQQYVKNPDEKGNTQKTSQGQINQYQLNQKIAHNQAIIQMMQNQQNIKQTANHPTTQQMQNQSQNILVDEKLINQQLDVQEQNQDLNQKQYCTQNLNVVYNHYQQQYLVSYLLHCVNTAINQQQFKNIIHPLQTSHGQFYNDLQNQAQFQEQSDCQSENNPQVYQQQKENQFENMNKQCIKRSSIQYNKDEDRPQKVQSNVQFTEKADNSSKSTGKKENPYL